MNTPNMSGVKLPISIQQQGPDEWIVIIGPEPQNRFICRMSSDIPPYQRMEYARHIVRAANCHDELIAVLQCATRAFEGWPDWSSEALAEVTRSCRAILAKAKGEA